ncbi:hypothetical protein Hanom_Chr16g01450911 [Helianthus anomalus]
MTKVRKYTKLAIFEVFITYDPPKVMLDPICLPRARWISILLNIYVLAHAHGLNGSILLENAGYQVGV